MLLKFHSFRKNISSIIDHNIFSKFVFHIISIILHIVMYILYMLQPFNVRFFYDENDCL